MLVKRVVVGPYSENCYVLVCQISKEGIIVDPGDDAAVILQEADGVLVKLIVITHAHPDHIGALVQVASATRAPVAAHPLDADRLPIAPERLLQDGDTVSFGDVTLRVIHTPGHTPGSICLLDDGQFIAGDTIFPNGPGKTATPELLQQVVRTIADKIMTLPDTTVIHPGHGSSTTVGAERPAFTAFAGKPIPPDLCGDVTWTDNCGSQ